MMLLLPKVLLLGVLTGSPFWLQGCSEFELPSDRRLQAEPLPPAVAPLAPPVPPAPLPPMPTLPPPATLDETLKKKPKPMLVTPEPILGCPPPPVAGAVPSPPPPGYTPRLIVRNLCPNLDMWIASSGNVPGERNVKIPPNGTHQYFIPPGGLSSTRFWPKLWCNEYGQNCAMGSSGGDCQDCSQAGCAPPVDSKFEASFGALGVDCAVDNKGCDWWDTSAVDGFSLPYEVKVDKCPQGKNINCLGLSLGQCPSSEILGAAGAQDLRVVDPASKKVVGCYSPCGKLTYSNWHNPIGAHAPNSEEAKMFCCPTPPVSSEACRMGPVEQTQFVKLIHQSCPNVYGYAYDDAVGLQVCPSGTTYTWSIGCPTEPKGSLYF